MWKIIFKNSIYLWKRGNKNYRSQLSILNTSKKFSFFNFEKSCENFINNILTNSNVDSIFSFSNFASQKFIQIGKEYLMPNNNFKVKTINFDYSIEKSLPSVLLKVILRKKSFKSLFCNRSEKGIDFKMTLQENLKKYEIDNIEIYN